MSYLNPKPRPTRAPADALALLNLCASLASLSRQQGVVPESSLARRLYHDAWNRLLAGEGALNAMLATLAEALAATRLGNLDPAALAGLGVAAPVAAQARLRAFAAAATAVDPDLRLALRLYLPGLPAPGGALPAVLAALAEHPPGAAPGESLAEQSLRLALLAALMACETGAAPELMFLAALSHGLPEEMAGVAPALQAELLRARLAVALPGSAAGRAVALARAGGPSHLPVSLAAA